MSVFRFALLAGALLMARTASAADLPVSYLVEDKPLKAAVAGTPITFELYTDNTCTTLAQSIPVAVENISILSRLKQLTPKNDTKLPNTVELRTTLAGVTELGNLYLKVTGTGVVAVGEACQSQASQVASINAAGFHTVTLQYNLNSPGKWGIVNPNALGLVDGTNIAILTAEAANAVLALSTSSTYVCQAQWDTSVFAIPGQDSNYIGVFALTGCTPSP